MFPQGSAGHEVCPQRFELIVAGKDLFLPYQRFFDPLSEQTGSHRTFAFVQEHPQRFALAFTMHRFHKFQIANRRKVHIQHFRLTLDPDHGKMIEGMFLSCLKIIQHPSAGSTLIIFPQCFT